MRWFSRLLQRRPRSMDEYRVACALFSGDGARQAEVLEFKSGDTYLRESELRGEVFEPRHEGRLVGPFRSPEAAERFIVGTAWFNGRSPE